PERVRRKATRQVKTDHGHVIHVTPEFIEVKNKLIDLSYPAQAEIAMQTAANRFAGDVRNPLRSITTEGESSGETVTNVTGGDASIKVGTDGVGVGHTDDGSTVNSGTNTRNESEKIESDLTNSTAQLKDL